MFSNKVLLFSSYIPHRVQFRSWGILTKTSYAKNYIIKWNPPYRRELSVILNHNSVRNFTLITQHNLKKESESYIDYKSRVSDNDGEEPVSKKKVMEMRRWYEMYRDEGGDTPQRLSDDHITKMLELQTFSQRRKYLNYLKKNEYYREKDTEIKEKKNEAKILRNEVNRSGHIKYGLWANTMFIKTTDRTIKKFYNSKAFNAMVYGQSIVYDCSFENHMTPHEINSFSEQLKLSLIQNRTHLYPFDIHFTSFDRKDPSMVALEKRMPVVFWPMFPIHLHSKSYLDVFPRDKLIYLSPNARETMRKLEPDATYIIGGIVDRGIQQPFTMSKAKRQRIRVQKLPLDQHMIFKGGKALAVHVVLAILLDLQITGDWKYAFRNVPRRLIQEGQSEGPSPWDLKHREKPRIF